MENHYEKRSVRTCTGIRACLYNPKGPERRIVMRAAGCYGVSTVSTQGNATSWQGILQPIPSKCIAIPLIGVRLQQVEYPFGCVPVAIEVTQMLATHGV